MLNPNRQHIVIDKAVSDDLEAFTAAIFLLISRRFVYPPSTTNFHFLFHSPSLFFFCSCYIKQQRDQRSTSDRMQIFERMFRDLWSAKRWRKKASDEDGSELSAIARRWRVCEDDVACSFLERMKFREM